MQLLSKFNKGLRLCVIDIFSKYAWVIPLKDKKCISIVNASQKILDDSKRIIVKKTDYNKLVTKVNNIDTSGLVKKTDYNTKITEIKDKIPDTSGLVKKTDYNAKITEIEDKIPDTSNFARKTSLTTVENKIPDISSLVKKSDYNREITDIGIKINNLQTYSLSYFRGKQYFDEGSGKQNDLVFRPM